MNRELYSKALTIRLFEEKLLSLFSEGKLSGTVHTCIGQELSGLAIAGHLRKDDWVFSNHRCHGHYLARFNDISGLLAEIRGLPGGICAGRGGSQHIYHEHFLSNGVQGGSVPIAAGCALALGKINGASGMIATVFIGDGTLGQGVLYETLNLISKWEIPLLIVVEHNGYAQSTSTSSTIAGTIRARFEAFGVRCWESSVWDEDGLMADAQAAVDYVRTTRVPAAISIACYRLKAHSKGDDNRDRGEIASFEEKDPLRVFEKSNPDVCKEVRAQCDTAINNATRLLDDRLAAPLLSVDPCAVQMPAISSPCWRRLIAPPHPQRVVERLRSGLSDLLSRDETVILLGEDVEDPYGGAFKVTKGLSTAFPGRVRNTPISEAAIVGVGNGLALAGRRPIVEIMFGDFITLAADQLINQATKFAYMYNEQVSVPIIVRTPMGGHRGYGATHSQCLEKVFFGTPGLDIVAVNDIFDPSELLDRVHKHLRGPCLFLESKCLYGTQVRQQAADGRNWQEDGSIFPTLKLEAAGGQDLTIVAYGGMVHEVEDAVKQAFVEHEIACEVLVPTRIFPLDLAPIIDSVGRTKRLLLVEEGQGFAGFGAEVIASCCEQLGSRAIAAERVYAAPHPIPCSRDLEKQALPSAAQVLEAILKVVKS